ncbi:hypothetical protein ACQP2T_31365 [Nonomuraea sp. CA-143628]|uniref:hypothetical protein n=1 Tax=Nonomuraea sp. CA-143628 TaxID=3239997 RepID=UPI003D89DC14
MISERVDCDIHSIRPAGPGPEDYEATVERRLPRQVRRGETVQDPMPTSNPVCDVSIFSGAVAVKPSSPVGDSSSMSVS